MTQSGLQAPGVRSYRLYGLFLLQVALLFQQLYHPIEAEKRIALPILIEADGAHVPFEEEEFMYGDGSSLFSNPPGPQMDLFGVWEVSEFKKRADPWYFTFGVEVEKNTIEIKAPNETNSWIAEYEYNDATKIHTIDVHIKKGGPDNSLANLISYGIFKASSGSFILALAEAGFPYRPVKLEGDSNVKLFVGKKLNYPEQIHLAYGKDPQTTITVSWVSRHPTTKSLVQYGLSSGQYQFQASGSWSNYTYKTYHSGAIHSVFISNLKPATTYFYRCGEAAAGWSKEYSFTTASPDPQVSVVVYGDLNLQGAWAGSHTYAESLSTIHYVNELEDSSSFILNVGDIAYCNGDSPCWDVFFKYMQTIIARKPMMVCQGNHDADPEPYGYRSRFFMPSKDTDPSRRDYFYSFDVGPIHFVGYSTELWFLPFNTTMNVTEQMEWLENDLIEANQPQNREQRPWIVAFGHRPLYCTSSWPDCNDEIALTLLRNLEPLFNKYGVDMVIAGHIHSMERSYPISFDGVVAGTYAQPQGTVHIGAGMAGQGFLGPWEKGDAPAWNAWRAHIHGYSKIVASSSELVFSFIANNGSTLDSITLGEPFKGTYYDEQFGF